jgi:hypothetical protein
LNNLDGRNKLERHTRTRRRIPNEHKRSKATRRELATEKKKKPGTLFLANTKAVCNSPFLDCSTHHGGA